MKYVPFTILFLRTITSSCYLLEIQNYIIWQKILINYYQPFRSLYVIFFFFTFLPPRTFFFRNVTFQIMRPFFRAAQWRFSIFHFTPCPQSLNFYLKLPRSLLSFLRGLFLLFPSFIRRTYVHQADLRRSATLAFRKVRMQKCTRGHLFPEIVLSLVCTSRQCEEAKKRKMKREGEHHLHYHYCMRLRKSKKVRQGEGWEDCNGENGRKNVVICGY